MRYSTTIPEEIIDTFEFNFIQAKYQNSNITNDLLNNHTAIQDFLVQLFFGQDEMDDPKIAGCIHRFKKLLAEERLSMLNFPKLDKMYKQSKVEGVSDTLLGDNNEEE